MKTFIAIALLALAISGCGPYDDRKLIKVEQRPYRLLGYDPPKHFYVDLQDAQTMTIYKRVYVSKHCNDHRSLRVDEIYPVRIATYKDKEGNLSYGFYNLYGDFCQ